MLFCYKVNFKYYLQYPPAFIVNSEYYQYPRFIVNLKYSNTHPLLSRVKLIAGKDAALLRHPEKKIFFSHNFLRISENDNDDNDLLISREH